MWGWVASLSVFLVAVTSPLIGAVADRAGVRRSLLVVYTLLGIGAVAAFVGLEKGMVWPAFALAVLANVGFEGGQVFYNAWLPDIAPRDHQGRVSGLGFGLGYAGSAVGLIAAIPLARAGRLDLLWMLVAAWWLVFSLPAFLLLPGAPGVGESVGRAARNGVLHFRRLVEEVWSHVQMRRFLFAYFFYIDGVNTVITMSALFATGTLGFTRDQTIVVFLVVQFSALAGSFLLARPTDTWGPKRVILSTLVLWSVVAVSAMFITSKTTFFGVATLAGLGLGSIQAASRSFMSALIPEGKEAEMFGFYSFCGKTSSILGPLLFGFVERATGSQRLAVMAIAVFFVVGALLLTRAADPIVDAPARGRETALGARA